MVGDGPLTMTQIAVSSVATRTKRNANKTENDLIILRPTCLDADIGASRRFGFRLINLNLGEFLFFIFLLLASPAGIALLSHLRYGLNALAFKFYFLKCSEHTKNDLCLPSSNYTIIMIVLQSILTLLYCILMGDYAIIHS
jgi:hypothetical protein